MASLDMVRVVVYDRTDAYVCDIDPTQLLDLTSTEAVNGDHSLTIKTTQELAKTDRLLVRDSMGIWHEYVVAGLTGEHGGRKVGAVWHEYYCVWSVQYDLSATYIDTQVGLVPGHASVPNPPRAGLEAALSGTTRWQVGTITVTNYGSASFYRRSGWEGLKTLTENWGGEIDVTITVGSAGVTGRYVNLLEHVGATEAARRFDYGSDLKDIRRKVSEEVWPCRIVPLGKATETEAGGYTRRPTIGAANDGVVWLEDADAVPLTKVPDGNGGWEYPTSIIKNDVYNKPADLKAWALDHIGEYTRPQVTYEAELVQLVKAGLNPHGVALGDNVIVVDHDFCEGGLAITARVIQIRQSLLDSTDAKLTIGNAPKTLSGQLGGMSRDVARLEEQAVTATEYQTTAAYVSDLLGRINDEVNLDGGYFYIVEGIGARCYDTQVSDPAVGSEATKAVEIRGGTIRIADTKTAQGEWIWRTVFVSGHIASELVTTAQLVAGYIGNSAATYWDLDTGVLHIAPTGTLGTKTVQQVIDGVDATITGVDVQYAQGTSPTTAPTTGWSTTAPAWEAGKYIWQRTATTTASGTTYSTPAMISGKDGTDGTSVTILGSYNTYADLVAAHPTGSLGDGYLVGGDLYVWNGTQWDDVGTIQGPQGPAGSNGTPAYVHVAWANSADGTVDFSTSVSAGKSYLGSYTDSTAADSTTPSTYHWSKIKGDKGDTGKGIASVTEQYARNNSSTTVPTSGWGTTVLTPTSSERFVWNREVMNYTDGTSSDPTTAHVVAVYGQTGATGKGISSITEYYAASNTTTPPADSAFSTTVQAPTSSNRYLWNYEVIAYTSGDPTTTDKRIIGTYGEQGDDGVGISAIVEQYYLSTSSVTQEGGSWSTDQPAWVEGKYIWTRSLITWDDGTTSTTSPVLAQAINSANQSAADAAKVATNYLDFDPTVGLDIGYSSTDGKVRINGSGVEVFDGDGYSALYAGLDSGNDSIVRVGRSSGTGNVIMSSDGSVDIRSSAEELAHFGYGEGISLSGRLAIAPYYTLGTRAEDGIVGNYSVAMGLRNEVGGYAAMAVGRDNVINANCSYAFGDHLTTAHADQVVVGTYNADASETGTAYFTVGVGSQWTGRENALEVYATAVKCTQDLKVGDAGNRCFIYLNGSIIHTSDNRLKTHVGYIGDDGADFIRRLRPARFRWNGSEEEHLGFYAQDVQEADPWGAVTTTMEHSDELGYAPLAIDYTALIAPLVAYCQQLERRLEALESKEDK